MKIKNFPPGEAHDVFTTLKLHVMHSLHHWSVELEMKKRGKVNKEFAIFCAMIAREAFFIVFP